MTVNFRVFNGKILNDLFLFSLTWMQQVCHEQSACYQVVLCKFCFNRMLWEAENWGLLIQLNKHGEWVFVFWSQTIGVGHLQFLWLFGMWHCPDPYFLVLSFFSLPKGYLNILIKYIFLGSRDNQLLQHYCNNLLLM